ncbi:MAG: DNA polymerase III subunit delta' [Chloroflexota bacterium]
MWNVIGQDKAVNSLKRSLEAGRLFHAYLFVGAEHVGKMTLAITLAQALNCASTEAPCGECHICRRIASGNHPDLQIIRTGATNGSQQHKEISIEQVREVQHMVSLRPYEGNYRVIITQDAEYMSEGAANCFLKTLEEPPPFTLFILLTSDASGLLPTIISRCQRIDLERMPFHIARQALTTEKGLSPERAELLARLSGGCIGWAISAADDENIVDDRSQVMERLISVARWDISERFAFASELAGEFSNDRASVRTKLALWLTWWRDLLLAKSGCTDFITNIDRREEVERQAGQYETWVIHNMIRSIRETMQRLDRNANPRLALEVLMLQLPFEREGSHASS